MSSLASAAAAAADFDDIIERSAQDCTKEDCTTNVPYVASFAFKSHPSTWLCKQPGSRLSRVYTRASKIPRPGGSYRARVLEMVRRSGGLHIRGRQRVFEWMAFNYSPVILDSDHIPLRISRFARPLSRSPLPSVVKDDRFRRCVNLARDIGGQTADSHAFTSRCKNAQSAWLFTRLKRRSTVCISFD